jgi:uncharacterized protein (TIGR00255 family)
LSLLPTFEAMIKSMTGFGKAQVVFGLKSITIDIRALNSKLLDLNLRLPSIYREKEGSIRTHLGQLLERGKLDVYINRKLDGASSELPFNQESIRKRYRELEEIAAELGASTTNLLSDILKLPDMLAEQEELLSDEEWLVVSDALKTAISQTDQFRKDEGLGLEKELLMRIENIGNLLSAVHTHEESRMITVKSRLMAKLEELGQLTEKSANRFEEELIYFLEKLDISEEKQRLSTHLNYFVETMAESGASGRKLGFITQELGREINTIGSKANHAEMQKIVVLMKDELEKIKEQLNNIL